MKQGLFLGQGCTVFQSGLPEHNPTPSTPRGKRRHAARNEGQKKHAESAWGQARSTRETKMQQALRQNGLTRGV